MTVGDATRAQVTAAHPGRSTWLSANAGSGKTSVLTNRVARLLLDGVDPQRVLCLTYTKAAATEMQNRLFRELGTWTMLPEDELEKKLRSLGHPDARNTAAGRNRARTLFAQAIETPGGLKIQTIHSFCGALLRRFPLEAGVSPAYRELDDLGQQRLISDVLDTLARGPERALFDRLARHLGGNEDPVALTRTLMQRRDEFETPPAPDDIRAALGLPPGFTPEDWGSLASDGTEDATFAEAVPLLRAESAKGAQVLADLLTRWIEGDRSDPFRETLFRETLLSEGTGPKVKSVPNKKFQGAHPDLTEELHAFLHRLYDTACALGTYPIVERTEVLHAFARAVIPAVDHAKTLRGLVDFDDMIARVRAMLRDPQIAEWVLFKLDGGIDHILVDEAQDTSPAQWDIIRALAAEFAAGRGAQEDVTRTLFVVGDPKQSIYSFQGADPDAFDRMRQHFATAFSDAGRPMQTSVLQHSFRSSPAILRAVDSVFTRAGHRGLGMDSAHVAFRSGMPGRVDLWPLVEPPETPPQPEFGDPVDSIPATHPKIVLARRVVDEMVRLLDAGTRIAGRDGTVRAVTPGDFLVLVQGRDALFHELIRRCKEVGLPIAGADRLRIGGEIAVKDLTALLSFLATPDDSLSLAAALRSPLFGWSEQDLYALAQPRTERHLWQALRKPETAARHPETLRILHDLRDRADYLRPYELLERILIVHGGRARLIARLGAEAEDGIDALLGQALAHERRAVPDLTGFLGALAQDIGDLKRPLDAHGGAVRVMSVHGAKGLEAPIVILPDAASRKPRGDGAILRLPGGPTVWRTGGKLVTPPLAEAQDARKTQDEEERLRLLYVAMTRAESWLMVAAAGKTDAEDETPNAWHALVDGGLRALNAAPRDMPGGEGLRFAMGDWPDPGPAQPWTAGADSRTPLRLPAAAPPGLPAAPVSPSDLGGAKALPGASEAADEAAAKRRGSALHWLLEHLPAWPRADHAALAAQNPEVTAADLAEVQACLDAPDLAALFTDPGLLREVPVSGTLPHGLGPAFGVLDLVEVTPERVRIVDFKSNATVPATAAEVPEGLLRQMGAYRALAAQAFPGRPVEVALLWTRTATLMPLPGALTDAALARATRP